MEKGRNGRFVQAKKKSERKNENDNITCVELMTFFLAKIYGTV